MPVCTTSSCRKRKDLNADGVCPACVQQSEDSTCKQCNTVINGDSKALNVINAAPGVILVVQTFLKLYMTFLLITIKKMALNGSVMTAE